MKFFGKNTTYDKVTIYKTIIRATRNQCFTLSLENTFLERPLGWGWVGLMWFGHLTAKGQVFPNVVDLLGGGGGVIWAKWPNTA